MAGRNYSDLVAWQKAMDLVEAVYQATAMFPKDELYGLSSQLRRAAVSIPSNIAEGQGRHTAGEFTRFLSIALGSLREVETQILIARRLRYIGNDHAPGLMAMTSEVGRLLNGL